MLDKINVNGAPKLSPFERYVLVPIFVVFFFGVLFPALVLTEIIGGKRVR